MLNYNVYLHYIILIYLSVTPNPKIPTCPYATHSSMRDSYAGHCSGIMRLIFRVMSR